MHKRKRTARPTTVINHYSIKAAEDAAQELKVPYYVKDASTGSWWDGYNNETVLIIHEDDISKKELDKMKVGYPIKRQVKGGTVETQFDSIFLICEAPEMPNSP